MRVLVLGAGMIVRDQLLPSLYHLERQGRISSIEIYSRTGATLEALAADRRMAAAFPAQSFSGRTEDYAGLIAQLPPRSLVVVALPDHLHDMAIQAALQADQNVLCVKPLVLRGAQAEAIGREAHQRGLLVATDYHKRFDDRSHIARQRYREGLFGEFRLGSAHLFEKWFYRHSNFQNWFTCENSDAFTYIGCHYVDLVHFITGLLPVQVSVYGIEDKLPNGKGGYLWTDARVLWQNGACLNVQNGLGFPDAGPGSNTQGLTMFFSGDDCGGWLAHSDQYRGLRHGYVECPPGSGSNLYAEPSPDYFTYVEYGGPGLAPAGYGFRSVQAIVNAASELAGKPLAARRALLDHWDAAGLLATPANSAFNDWLIEAARASILSGGRSMPVKSV